jgi:hypothetical protein
MITHNQPVSIVVQRRTMNKQPNLLKVYEFDPVGEAGSSFALHNCQDF